MLRKKYQKINEYWMQTDVKKTFLSVRPWQWILFCLFLLICYGAKLFYYNFGIDNESFAFRYGPAMKEFIQSGRFSIYLVKKVLHIFPFVPIFSLFLWILAFADLVVIYMESIRIIHHGEIAALLRNVVLPSIGTPDFLLEVLRLRSLH